MTNVQIDKLLALLFVISKSLETIAGDNKKIYEMQKEAREENKIMNALIVKKLSGENNDQ